MTIFVSSILMQHSEEIPALNDILVLHILLDGGHFGQPLTVADTGTISHASISEDVHSK